MLIVLPLAATAQKASSAPTSKATRVVPPIAAPRAGVMPATKSVPSATPAAAVPAKTLVQAPPIAAATPVDIAADSPNRIRWQAPQSVRVGKGVRRMPVFEGSAADRTTGLPLYQLRLEQQAIGSFTLRDTRYEPLPAAEAKLIDAAKLPTTPEAVITIGTELRRPTSFVTFTPLRRNPQTGGVERLVGFDYSTTTTSIAARPSSPRATATNSVLAQGRWIKIGLTETGVYRIDRGQLQSLGLDPSSFDARNLQLWGNGGRMLPQLNQAPRADDLVENAVIVDETNGSFNALVFYAQGPHGWDLQTSNGRYKHETNLYSDSAFYFLTVGNQPGRRIATVSAPGSPNGPTVTTSDEHLFYESNLVNLLKEGREWYGELFDSFNPTREFTFGVEGIDLTTPVQITTAVLGSSPGITNPTTFRASVNGQASGTISCPGYYVWDYHEFGTETVQTLPAPTGSIGSDGQIRVRLAFNGAASGSGTGYLNYLEVNCRRNLRRYGGQTNFRSAQTIGAGNIREFRVENCDANSQVWDVTNPLRPRRQTLTLTGSTGSFVAATDSLREFVVVNPDQGRTDVRSFGTVAPQNLHALNAPGTPAAEQIDLVIVTAPQYLNQAKRLADHRQQHDGLQVAVATTTQVWNEFGSGRQDITAIRDLMRLVYSRTTDPATYPVSLLLFGDASYDYKSNQWYSQRPGAPRPLTPDNTNLVPTYEARESLDPIGAFSSEDFYALLDDNEGFWAESNSSELMDIGVGRLPAHDDVTASSMVDKLIRYDAASSFGKWRNQMTFVSDDDENNAYTTDCEELISMVEPRYPAFNMRKLYLDLFPQVSVPSGQRSPTTYANIEQAVDKGSLLVTYVGHGGETGWAAEQILDIAQVNRWRNTDKLAFFMTATCEFGRYDDPARSSGAEYALSNAQGGAIGLFTTTRPVYANDNQILNRNFYNNAFTPRPDGSQSRIGDILRRTKSTGSAVVLSRNVTLLGDPSMRLAVPTLRATLTHLNDQPLAVSDTIRALARVKFSGEIQDGTGQLVSNFNGQIQVTVYEKEADVLLRGDWGAVPAGLNPIKVRESVIYDGLATVTNGKWQASFVVPRDISYSFGKGKVSLYAWSADRDAAGAGTTIVIGGSSGTVAQDNLPPAIKLFMDDLSFQNGGATSTDATLIAPLSDDNGINTAGTGIGHEITVTLDGNRQNQLVMNPYYTADVDSYTSGTVKYLFKGLTPGPHSLTLKAWDTFNNSSERTLDFVVENSASLALDHVLNYPNPFANHTTFHFDHNRQGDDLDVQVQVFTVAGRLVRTVQGSIPTSTAHVGDLTWDGRDEFGDVLARGVYVYKVNVRSTRDGAHTSKYEKLVILN
jgi:Peptidase family C25